jgi:hypothetical protein
MACGMFKLVFRRKRSSTSESWSTGARGKRTNTFETLVADEKVEKFVKSVSFYSTNNIAYIANEFSVHYQRDRKVDSDWRLCMNQSLMSPLSLSMRAARCFERNRNLLCGSIIFVHGLTGGRISTWSMPSETEPWPKKFLSKSIPQARISTFGYDAEVVNLWNMSSQNGVRDHARKLVNALVVLREDSPSVWFSSPVCNNTNLIAHQDYGAPIIFIAHSLGGLVCEEALVLLSQSTTDSHRRLWSGPLGIMLIGVPHGGSALAKWAERSATLLPRQVNKKLLQVLRTDSELLSRLQEDFQVAISARRERLSKVQIACFFEELAIRGMKQMVSGEDVGRE